MTGREKQLGQNRLIGGAGKDDLTPIPPFEMVRRLIQDIGRREEHGSYSVFQANMVPVGIDGTSMGDNLVLGEVEGLGSVSVLHYQCTQENHPKLKVKVKIDLIQKHSDVDIKEARKKLGAHPHNLLVEAFIRRLRPILDLVPSAEVTLEPPTHSEELLSQVYRPIRNRYFTRDDWRLNPHRKAVQRLLGEDLCRRMLQDMQKPAPP